MASVDVSYVDFQARASSTSPSVQVSNIDFVATAAGPSTPAAGQVSYVDLTATGANANPASVQISYVDLTAHAANTNPPFSQISYVDLTVNINSSVPATAQLSFVELVAQNGVQSPPPVVYLSYLDLQASTNAPVTVDVANAGNDVTVRPFGTYSITGTGSSAGVWSLSGNLSDVSFSQANGVLTYTPVPKLSGSRITMIYTVGSVSDAVVITVYPVSERAVIDGVQKTLQWNEVTQS